MKRVNVRLDGNLIQVEPGTTILAAAEKMGIFIPTLCHSTLLTPRAACYVCVVEVEGQADLVPACSTEIADNMVVLTSTERVKGARRTCIELLLSDHLGDCLGPCMRACPAGIDIAGFINYIAQGEERHALDLIRYSVPFPGSLGRICDRPCEDACRRQLVEEPIAVCHLKRYVSDVNSAAEEEKMPGRLPSTGKRVAIVGAGPAGLTAAYFLQILGHSCTIFDSNDHPGGRFRYGIPQYRLPLSVVEREIACIEKLGADMCCNTCLGKDITLAGLRNDYDVVFLGLGAQVPLQLNIEGESAGAVIPALTLLAEQGSDTAKGVGSKVIVIGGGGVAVDAARTAVRKGAKEVHIYCLEKKEQMPATHDEIKVALDEGISIHNEWGVKRIISKEGMVKGLELKRCIAVFDEQGTFSPRYDNSKIVSDTCDTLIIAAGQRPDLSCIDCTTHVDTFSELIQHESLFDVLRVNENTMETPLKGVFAGGDCVTGPGTAVNAVAAGRKAAISIDQFLMGKSVLGKAECYNHSMGILENIPGKVVEKFEKTVRMVMPELKPGERTAGFEEVETGFTAEAARAEARRCMECGCRSAQECKLRSYASLFEADASRYDGTCREYDRDETHSDIVYDAHKCIQCRTCVRTAEELLGLALMHVVGRGFATRIRPADATMLSLVNKKGLSLLVENCPVGALTFKNAPVATVEPMFRQQEIK